LAGAEDAVDEGLGPGAFDCSGLDVLIGSDSGRFENVNKDARRESFEKEGHRSQVSSCVLGMVGQLFKLGDVLIDFSWLHN
jgi:hypothetical protein